MKWTTSKVIATKQDEREEERSWGEKWPFEPAEKPTNTIYVKIAIKGIYISGALISWRGGK